MHTSSRKTARRFPAVRLTRCQEAGALVSPSAWSGSQAQAAADDLLHDLGGAAEDGLDPAVGPGPAHGVLAHVAVAAVQLDAAVGDPVAQLGVPPLDHGRLFAGEPAGAVLGDGAVGELARDRS